MSQRKVDAMKRRFRILKDWRIDYRGATKTEMMMVGYYHNGSIGRYRRGRGAVLYGCPRGISAPKDFYLHEVLHCALHALCQMDRRKSKELHRAQEEFIQDICRIAIKEETK